MFLPSPTFVTAVAPISSFLPLSPLPFRCKHLPTASRRVQSSRPSLICCTSSPPSQDLSSLISTIDSKLAEATTAVAEATDEPSVDKVRVAYLGKKGSITTIVRLVGQLPKEDRPALGAAVNKAKDALTEQISARKDEIEMEEIRKQEETEWIDVTMPGIRSFETIGRIHPITSTMDLATDIFLNLGYDLIDDPDLNREIETDYYCFEALNCPPGHPARDMQDTFYLTEDQTMLLRTQTSAVQIRYMEKNKPPFKIIAPGRVYRRDTSDATHSATFHQIEILAIDEMGKLNFGTLRATMIHFLEQMLGEGIKTRFRGSYFPFTEPSVEVDVFFKGKWLEVLGCGMVDPAVLENVGLDPEKWSGFAAGFGVERFAMVMHEITDIRELYRNDIRFLKQFMIDSPWKDWKEFL